MSAMPAVAPPKGKKWVLAPVEKWEAPENAEYYSLAKSAIVCRLFYITDKKRMDFCVENNLMPPGNLNKGKLPEWIDEQMAAHTSKGKGQK
jgi:hypothetical protein